MVGAGFGCFWYGLNGKNAKKIKFLTSRYLQNAPFSSLPPALPYPVSFVTRAHANKLTVAGHPPAVNKKSHTPYYLGAAVEKLLAENPALATRDPASWADDDEHELIRLYAVYRATLSFKA